MSDTTMTFETAVRTFVGAKDGLKEAKEYATHAEFDAIKLYADWASGKRADQVAAATRDLGVPSWGSSPAAITRYAAYSRIITFTDATDLNAVRKDSNEFSKLGVTHSTQINIAKASNGQYSDWQERCQALVGLDEQIALVVKKLNAAKEQVRRFSKELESLRSLSSDAVLEF